jgi:hypothetical protein
MMVVDKNQMVVDNQLQSRVSRSGSLSRRSAILAILLFLERGRIIV